MFGFIALFIFSTTITIRIVLETAFLSENYFFSYYVLLHHYCWFSLVFLWVCFLMKHVAKMPPKKICYLSFASPSVLIPIVVAYYSGKPLLLDYISVRKEGFSSLFKSMLTLNYFHQDNSEQFIEMLCLIILIAVGSYLFSKSIKRTVVATTLAYFGSYLLSGVHWFGVNVEPRTSALFLIPSSLKNHQAMALIFYVLSLSVFLVLALPEIKKICLNIFSERSVVLSIVLFLAWMLVFAFIFHPPTTREISMFDLIMTFIPVFVMLEFILSFKIQTLNQRVLFGWVSLVGMLIIVPLFFGVY